MKQEQTEKKIREIITKYVQPFIESYEECRFNIEEGISKRGDDKNNYINFKVKTLNTWRVNINVDIIIFRESHEIVFFHCPDELSENIREYLMNNNTGLFEKVELHRIVPKTNLLKKIESNQK